MAARDAHLKLVNENKAKGHAKYGAAIIEDGKMVGSMMVVSRSIRPPCVTVPTTRLAMRTASMMSVSFAASI